ncbi:hypothetical protein MJO28_010863 [Puccinia striiformis f. sp. tritici]|uniref:Uncharacterized protein n=1 Tax=Puccinia striiformis f. sp. tritici TaxID=168172 RepID=A0ACC0E7N0_9BASI|nr:hypothetical protein MJO28_010863 [Puccinia striiformis f. sp. tritici]
MNSWKDPNQRPYTPRWVSMTIFTILTIGFTASTPTQHGAMTVKRAPVGRLKPPLGWNSFWPFGCEKDVSVDNLKGQADLLAAKGFAAAGYNTFIIECGWESSIDSNTGAAVRPPINKELTRKAFGEKPGEFLDYLKGKGLRLGLGTWGGPQLCPRPNQKTPDVKPLEKPVDYITPLANWGLSYLSHRACDWEYPDIMQYPDQAAVLNARYIDMQAAMRTGGVRDKVFYATGQWGYSPSENYPKPNSWKIADDTLDNWNSFIRTLNAYVPASLEENMNQPYCDLGLLQFGKNKLTMAEKTTQFLFWAAAKSPLILSTDISQLTQEEINLLQNPGVLAINQDDLGKPITLRKRYPDDMDVWAGPLSDGSTVAIVINWSDTDTQKTLKLEDLGFSSGYLNEVLTGKPLQTYDGKYGFDVPVHGSLLVRITEGQLAPQPNFKRFPVELAELSGGAYIKQLNTGVKVATGLKPKHEGRLLWKDIPGSSNDKTLVSFEYMNAQLSPGNMDDSKLNFKHVPLVINNKQLVYLDFPISGKLWEKPSTGFLASLPLRDGLNTILIQGEGDWAPDFVSLSVQQKS